MHRLLEVCEPRITVVADAQHQPRNLHVQGTIEAFASSVGFLYQTNQEVDCCFSFANFNATSTEVVRSESDDCRVQAVKPLTNFRYASAGGVCSYHHKQGTQGIRILFDFIQQDSVSRPMTWVIYPISSKMRMPHLEVERVQENNRITVEANLLPFAQ